MLFVKQLIQKQKNTSRYNLTSFSSWVAQIIYTFKFFNFSNGTMGLLEERAENLDFESLNELSSAQNLRYRLEDYFCSDEKRPIFVLGPKGSGKTFQVMKALSETVYRNKEFVPAMFIFERSKKVELLDPLKIASPEIWGERLELYSQDRKELLRSSNAIVVDDIHYICEAIVKKEFDPNKLIKFLKGVLDYVDAGKKAVLVSEDLVNFYTKDLGIKEFDELWPKFGLHPRPFCDDVKEWERFSDKIDYLAFREVSPYSYEEWCSLVANYGVDVQAPFDFVLYNLNPKPRAFVRFAKLFQPKAQIIIEDTKMKTLELLKGSVNKKEYEFYEVLLDLPVLEGGTDIKYFNKVLGAVKGIENLKKFERVINYVENVCERAAKVLPPYYDKRGFFDVRRTLKINYKNDPIETRKTLQRFITEEVPEKERDVVEEMAKIYFRTHGFSSYDISRVSETLKRLEKDVEFVALSRGLESREAREYFNKLVRNISKYYIQEGAGFYTRWLLYRPFQLAFSSILYETPSLEIIDQYLRREKNV